METCKTCFFFTAPPGSEERWKICSNPKMKVADVYQSVDNLPKDGVGYSDVQHSDELAELYVGEDFGCIHHTPK